MQEMIAKVVMKLELNQSSSCPVPSTTSRQLRKWATSKNPTQSTLRPFESRSPRSRRKVCGSWTKRWTRVSESIPIGTLMKNIQCQETLSVM